MKKYDFKKRAPFYFDVDDTILTENGEGPPYLFNFNYNGNLFFWTSN